MVDSILIVEDDPLIQKLLNKLLTLSGYSVRGVVRGDEAMAALERERPSLMLLDWNLPGKSGIDVCRDVRAHPRLRDLPVIMLSARTEIDDRVAGMDTGADDYVPKPYDDRELLARIRAQIRRHREMMEASPLTNLPGNRAIQDEIARRIAAAGPLAVGYADIDNFKVYNDLYGFAKGDEAIKKTAAILTDVVKDFVGHVGGDDFIFFSTPEAVSALAEEILKRFTAAMAELYSPEDFKRGVIIGKDRQGRLQPFPLMSLTIVAATNENFPITHPADVARIAAELKGYAKQNIMGKFMKDRRGEIYRIQRDTPA